MQNVTLCCRPSCTFNIVLPLVLFYFECALKLQKSRVKAFRIKAEKIGGNLQQSDFLPPVTDIFLILVLLEDFFF